MTDLVKLELCKREDYSQEIFDEVKGRPMVVISIDEKQEACVAFHAITQMEVVYYLNSVLHKIQSGDYDYIWE